MKRILPGFLTVAMVVAAVAIISVRGGEEARADLQLIGAPSTFSGAGGYSADGIGQVGTGGTVQAVVPVGSTVEQAYLYATYAFNLTPTLADRTIDFDGTNVVLTQLANAAPGPCCELSSARADVTTQVATKIGGGSAVPIDFAVNTDPLTLDGVALVVIFSNPALPLTTIAVLDGGTEQSGDTTTFNFVGSLDKTVAGFSAVMSLGSGFSYQGGDIFIPDPGTNICGDTAVLGEQSSLVDVNGTRLTSCAGNHDDGFAQNGALFTVGGVGDSTTNPSDPNQLPGDGALPRTTDDELYDLEPFMSQGDTQLVIETSNPSGDDILFLTVIAITAEAFVTTEICDDGVDNDGDDLVDGEDPDCATPTATVTPTATNTPPPTPTPTKKPGDPRGPSMALIVYRDAAKQVLSCQKGALNRPCNVPIGSTFSVDVKTDNAPPAGFQGYQVVLQYSGPMNLVQQAGLAENRWAPCGNRGFEQKVTPTASAPGRYTLGCKAGPPPRRFKGVLSNIHFMCKTAGIAQIGLIGGGGASVSFYDRPSIHGNRIFLAFDRKLNKNLADSVTIRCGGD